MNNNLLTTIPAVEPDELAYLQTITREMNDEKLRLFVTLYNARRKKAETILICCLIGFLGFAGIQRFLVGQMGMGILYFFTAGLCFIGTIVDVINHKQLAFEYNQQAANDCLAMVG